MRVTGLGSLPLAWQALPPANRWSRLSQISPSIQSPIWMWAADKLDLKGWEQSLWPHWHSSLDCCWPLRAEKSSPQQNFVSQFNLSNFYSFFHCKFTDSHKSSGCHLWHVCLCVCLCVRERKREGDELRVIHTKVLLAYHAMPLKAEESEGRQWEWGTSL